MDAAAPAPAPQAPPADGPVRVEVAGHELTLFVEPAPLFAAMLADIRAAQKRVWLETYIFLNDGAGKAVAEALKERARAGLDVRVHYDAVGSLSTPAGFFRDLERAGVRVHRFHSLWEALHRFSFLRVLNRRNHRKLLVLDDRVAYFGGMNVVDVTHLTRAEKATLATASAAWRDVHVRLVGPQQPELAESFERSWRRARGEPVPRRPKGYRRAELPPGEESIRFFDSGPGRKHTHAARVFTRLIRAAHRRITIAMAYFLPVGRVRHHLFRARRRGVFVQLVVPGASDVPVVQHATRYLYDRLLRRHFHVYERQTTMMHGKVMVVDGQWSVVGSANLDARSLWINLEFLAVIRSRPFAEALGEIVRHEIRHSRRVTLRDCLRQPCWRRWLDRLAWSLRWWL